jgi:hypothetical protein
MCVQVELVNPQHPIGEPGTKSGDMPKSTKIGYPSALKQLEYAAGQKKTVLMTSSANVIAGPVMKSRLIQSKESKESKVITCNDKIPTQPKVKLVFQPLVDCVGSSFKQQLESDQFRNSIDAVKENTAKKNNAPTMDDSLPETHESAQFERSVDNRCIDPQVTAQCKPATRRLLRMEKEHTMTDFPSHGWFGCNVCKFKCKRQVQFKIHMFEMNPERQSKSDNGAEKIEKTGKSGKNQQLKACEGVCGTKEKKQNGKDDALPTTKVRDVQYYFCCLFCQKKIPDNEKQITWHLASWHNVTKEVYATFFPNEVDLNVQNMSKGEIVHLSHSTLNNKKVDGAEKKRKEMVSGRGQYRANVKKA